MVGNRILSFKKRSTSRFKTRYNLNKLDNILINDPDDLSSIRIADFGLSVAFTNQTKTLDNFGGTILYMAPEQLFNKVHSKV